MFILQVVNFYMKMLDERDALLPRRRSHFFNTQFITRLQNVAENGNIGAYEFKNVSRWTANKNFLDIFAMDKLFVPINVSQSHWILAVIFMQLQHIRIYDSKVSLGHDMDRYLKDLTRWIGDEAVAKKVSVDIGEWTVSSRENFVPQQTNGRDCGVFTCMFADFLSDDLPLEFSQEHIPHFREKIVADICRGSLGYSIGSSGVSGASVAL